MGPLSGCPVHQSLRSCLQFTSVPSDLTEPGALTAALTLMTQSSVTPSDIPGWLHAHQRSPLPDGGIWLVHADWCEPSSRARVESRRVAIALTVGSGRGGFPPIEASVPLASIPGAVSESPVPFGLSIPAS